MKPIDGPSSDAETLAAAAPEGAVLGSYRIEQLLGRGATGAVFLAYDTKLHRRVALKALHGGARKETSAVELLREARNAAALNHPHICVVHEVVDTGETTYIAMEYVGGTSLRRRIDDGDLSLAEVLRLGMQAADALAHAHDHGVVHRDFKAANAMVTEDGRLKVVDFGLAQRADALVAAATMMPSAVQPGEAAGTPYSMAPEQVRGERADARADIWALGVLLYEMTAGRPPFKAATMPELFALILTGSPEPLPAGVPAALRDVIERCLERDPAKRYHDAREVGAALAAIEAGGTPAWGAVWPRRVRRRPLLAAGVAVLVAAAGLLAGNVGGVRERLVGGRAAGAPLRLAVLPFQNLTGDPAQDFLSDGLTEEMITQLGQLHPQRLSVVARTSSMRYKGTELSLGAIGRELGVDYLLEGSARREGNRVRISATLIDSRAETQRWSQSFDRELSGILTLQHDVARGVADALALALFPAEQARLASARRVDPEAHEAYLRGLVYWSSGDLDTALELFEHARRSDARHPLPFIGIARVWLSRAQSGIVSPEEALPPIKAALDTALDLDPAAPEAHFVSAAVAAWLEWDWPRAEAAFRRAIDANPSYAEARAFYAHYLHIVGRPDEAEAQIELAEELDPFNPLIRALYGVERMMAGRYDEALVQLDRALELAPGLRLAVNNLAQAQHSLGRYEQALEAERRFWSLIGADDIADLLAREYTAGGYERAMAAAADALAAEGGDRNVALVKISTLYARAGLVDRALDWLEAGYTMRDLNLPYIRAVPATETLRAEPRFRALVSRMNLSE